ncbi:MAG: universal stress protein [Desulfosarcinaceae bacterium]
MRILVAVDTTPASAFVVQEVARLAATTWADVTLLGIEAKSTPNEPSLATAEQADAQHPLVTSLRSRREGFLSHFGAEDSPYNETVCTHELVKMQNGLWEDLKVCRGAHKRLVSRIRPGNPARAILLEAHQSPCDLIVMGSHGADDGGENGRSVKKVIRETDASVLVVSESKQPKRIVACLDHDQVSQPSLEMINQMVTLYKADLEIVGISSSDGLAGDVDRKMGEILKYYAANGIKALVRVVAQSSLASFAAQAARENLVALWRGKQSLLRRLMPPKSVDRLLDGAGSSVLILK